MSTTPFTPESIQSLVKQADIAAQSLTQLAEATAEALQPVLQAYMNCWKQVSAILEANLKINLLVVEGLLGEWATVDDCQRYARWYNARHPGRRISWRRLNRTQCAQAYAMFHEQGTFVL